MSPLAQMLAGLVDHRLEGASCAGHHDVFDVRGDDETHADHADRIDLARTICDTCPVLTACHAVAQNMRPRDRTGVWAGTAYDHRGRPVRTKET